MTGSESSEQEVEYLSVEIPASLSGTRLDRAVSMLTGCSRARAAAEIAAGTVRTGERSLTSKSLVLRGGEVLELPESLLEESAPETPEADPGVDVRVVHADESVIVVDKAAGQVVHPGVGNATGTLVSGIIARFPEVADVGNRYRPGIVHRLDRPTSGLLVVARTERAYEALSLQMREHTARRTYLALVEGRIEPVRAELEGSIAKSSRGFGAMELSAQGRYARTSYRRLAVLRLDGQEVSLLQVQLETGRTHQIRVHLGAHGFPVYGDRLYGATSDFGDRIFLHAWRLAFVHPVSGMEAAFTAAVPADLDERLRQAELVEGSMEALGG
ncbi:MAG: RluA family pseudouridine synthase [Actinomycetota bacterium]|nr:RluA family pseudouridine synthase [Actinomycetota bacterium]